MKLKYLQVENLGSLEQFNLDVEGLCSSEEKSKLLDNCILVTGKMGAGKTLCLTAIATAVLTPLLTDKAINCLLPAGSFVDYANNKLNALVKIEASYLTIADDKSDSFVELISKTEVNHQKSSLSVNSSGKTNQIWCNFVRDNSRCFMLCYGPKSGDHFYCGNHVSQYNNDWIKRNAMRLEGILNPRNEHLMPLEPWLRPLKKQNLSRYNQVLELINELLVTSDFWFKGEYCDHTGMYVFESNGAKRTVNQVSTGVRELLALVCDLVFHIHSSTNQGENLEQISGMVLIDQFERNFDQDIKSTLLPLLCRKLTNIQFIVTTHSEAVIQSASGAKQLQLNLDKTKTVH